MSFRITHAGPKLWVVEEEVRRWWPLSSKWEPIMACDSQEDAIEVVKQRAQFEPHTSYYDKHGNMLIESVGW